MTTNYDIAVPEWLKHGKRVRVTRSSDHCGYTGTVTHYDWSRGEDNIYAEVRLDQGHLIWCYQKDIEPANKQLIFKGTHVLIMGTGASQLDGRRGVALATRNDDYDAAVPVRLYAISGEDPGQLMHAVQRRCLELLEERMVRCDQKELLWPVERYLRFSWESDATNARYAAAREEHEATAAVAAASKSTTESEAPSFKVGDRVRCSVLCSKAPGHAGEIRAIEDDSAVVDFAGRSVRIEVRWLTKLQAFCCTRRSIAGGDLAPLLVVWAENEEAAATDMAGHRDFESNTVFVYALGPMRKFAVRKQTVVKEVAEDEIAAPEESKP